MVEFPGFQAHLVDLLDPPHAEAQENLHGA
jgi:hypothetical protein